MAHEIDMSNDRANMAFTGSRRHIWHGLGQELTEDASIETWKKEAGLDWDVLDSPVLFTKAGNVDPSAFPGKKALYRSDTLAPLSIVGEDFKVVQPGEVLEFFRDLVSINGMKLSTAGSLFGGSRFWALAEIGDSVKIGGVDEIEPHLLLVTAVDGTLATTAKTTATRVVCNNTCSIAIAEQSTHLVRKTHRTMWDAKAVKIDMGLIDAGWERFLGNINKLIETPMNDSKALKHFQDQFFNPDLAVHEQPWGNTRRVTQLMDLYKNGAGADMGKGTAWGVFNAITNMYTHGTGRKSSSNQFWDSNFGASEKVKNTAMQMLLAAA